MTIVEDIGRFGAPAGLLDRERVIEPAGFNRWLVPPAALCIHLCIGTAYCFSVFWLPLSRALGVTAPKVCPDVTLAQELFTTACDWRVASMGWMYTLLFVLLGGTVGRLARALRPTQGPCRVGAVLVRRPGPRLSANRRHPMSDKHFTRCSSEAFWHEFRAATGFEIVRHGGQSPRSRKPE